MKINLTRRECEAILKRRFGIEHFYDEQWQVIERIFKGERNLLIERTGFGKSLCYQFPATLFDGVTVIFSPLISLMRDQVESLCKKGIEAKYINSELTGEEKEQAMNDALAGKVKILYIAPERQEDEKWIETTRHLKISMVVIDEAHTISVWGHDFRPAFRRIINLIKLLPDSIPVLATTATATKRVQKDIESIIGGKLKTIRGCLYRPNFKLYVIKVKSEDEKMIWIAENINRLDKGTGLIYTGTRVTSEIYANWLSYLNIDSTYYNAGLDKDSRVQIEQNLKANKYRCVVSTNALGMGIDKPDIRFIIHTQMPASPIHYYQEIGRAGRDGAPCTAILFYNDNKTDGDTEEDYKLPKAFVEGGRPDIKYYNKVIEALKENPKGEKETMMHCNIKQTPFRVIKADLLEQGIISEVTYNKRKFYEYKFGAPSLDTTHFEELRRLKTEDLKAMHAYINTKEPRMAYLCRFLDDTSYSGNHNCDNTTLNPMSVNITQKWQKKLNDFRETYFPILQVETKRSNIINGVAASYYGTSNVGNALHRCKYEGKGDFPDFLVILTLKAFHRTFGKITFDYILFVPPTSSGDLVKNFATKISKALEIPLSDKLIKTRVTKEQKIFENGYNKRDNIDGAFDYSRPEEIKDKNILLIDDIYDSGATIKEIGAMLTQYEAKLIAPLTIAKTIGGDTI